MLAVILLIDRVGDWVAVISHVRFIEGLNRGSTEKVQSDEVRDQSGQHRRSEDRRRVEMRCLCRAAHQTEERDG